MLPSADAVRRNGCRISLGVCVIALAACNGDQSVGSGRLPSGLTVIAGSDVSDTVEALLQADLLVQLADKQGKAMKGADVAFEGASEPASVRPLIQVARVGSSAFALGVVVRTDGDGKAAARIRLGQSAGEVRVRIRSMRDSTVTASATYRVNAGNAVRLVLAPRDTAVYVGRSVTIRAQSADRFGNLVAAAPTMSTGSPIATVAATTVTATAIGRTIVRGIVGGARDSVYLSIPPVGVIAALVDRVSTSEPVRYVMVGLDGSGLVTRATVDGFAEAGLAFSPSGGEVLYGNGSHTTTLLRSGTGAVTPFFQVPLPLASSAFPRYSRDGAWVYFAGRPGHQNGEIWRARADGSSAERVGAAADDFALESHPDPSPDGTRVVYGTNRVNSTMPVLRLLDVATRAIDSVDLPGLTPRWSPDGQSIAYVTAVPQWGYLEHNRVMRSTGQLALANAQGRNPRLIPVAGARQWMPHIDFSPDSRYLIAASSAGILEVVDVRTGETIPLAHTLRYLMPTWKP